MTRASSRRGDRQTSASSAVDDPDRRKAYHPQRDGHDTESPPLGVRRRDRERRESVHRGVARLPPAARRGPLLSLRQRSRASAAVAARRPRGLRDRHRLARRSHRGLDGAQPAGQDLYGSPSSAGSRPTRGWRSSTRTSSSCFGSTRRSRHSWRRSGTSAPCDSNWHVFGHNGYFEDPEGLVTASLTRRMTAPSPRTKAISRIDAVSSIDSAHFCRLKPGWRTVDANGRTYSEVSTRAGPTAPTSITTNAGSFLTWMKPASVGKTSSSTGPTSPPSRWRLDEHLCLRQFVARPSPGTRTSWSTTTC